MFNVTNIFLIGMMGAGKSTVGKLLAQKINYNFLDTDPLIEQCVGKSIPEIFTNDSENTFRDLEQQVLAQVSAHTRLVVATGGGIVMRSLNWSHLHDGIVVWIDVLVEILYDIMVSEAETSQEVCDRLLSMIQSRITPDRLRQNV